MFLCQASGNWKNACLYYVPMCLKECYSFDGGCWLVDGARERKDKGSMVLRVSAHYTTQEHPLLQRGISQIKQIPACLQGFRGC